LITSTGTDTRCVCVHVCLSQCFCVSVSCTNTVDSSL
jgi:hypothetical protein